MAKDDYEERRVGRYSFKTDEQTPEGKPIYTPVGFMERNKWGGYNVSLCTVNKNGKWVALAAGICEDGTEVDFKGRRIRFFPEPDVTMNIPDEDL